VVMRQSHRAGEKLFVDYAGQSASIVAPTTGEVRKAQVFVAVLGASNYTFAEATWTQALPDWCASHVRALSFLQGVPEIVVPDNLRCAVRRAHRYEPDTHPTYTDLAEHYGFAIVPARVRRPRDKAKAEVGVQGVERWVLAALRHRTLFSLAELNEAIAERLEWLNARPLRKLPGSRRSAFESIDRPALRPLPAEPYVFAQWCCFPLYLVGSPRDLTGLFHRRISWDDGAIRNTSDRGEVSFRMKDGCRSAGDEVVRAAGAGKGWASAVHLSMPCPHGP